MKLRETQEQALRRWEELEVLQAHYKDFLVFLRDVMQLLGFGTTPLQEDIAQFLVYGPMYLMVQAQRGQAKTTITAAFAVWSLIHNPRTRVLIVSAGGTQANEISTLIVRIIMTMEELECMRPDASNGDRTSVEHFDLHYSLKGLDKSPSVACCGITATLQGKRADLLVADDIESAKNSMTATMREQLLAWTRDFTSINQSGRIIYLGTPQSAESVYNTLPARGFTVRIWPGRFPTPEQLEHYGEHLAPSILRAVQANPALQSGGGIDGNVGRPTDPILLPEQVLQAKERDQGPAYFALQHMLSTKMLDAERYPLKPERLVCMELQGEDMLPLEVHRNSSKRVPVQVEAKTYECSSYHLNEAGVQKRQSRVMYVDPAGGGKGKGSQGGDETAYCIMDFLNGNLFIRAVGGIKGGYDMEQMQELADIAKLWEPDVIKVEKNFGYGAFTAVWLPVLRLAIPDVGVEDDMVSGQKELRIIETLEPILARGSLVIAHDVLRAEAKSIEKYPQAIRHTYSFLHQMQRITRDKDALVHDDRLDAVAGAANHFLQSLAIDQNKALEAQRAAEFKKWLKDPMGRDRYSSGPPRRRTMIDKYIR